MAQPISDTPYKPQMNRRMIKRGIIGLIVVLILLGLVMAVQHFKDIDLPAKANTAGWLAALQAKDGGAQAVLIKPDGTIVPSPDYTEGANDREIVWRPDGNRVFFVSDRLINSNSSEMGVDRRPLPGIFRWNPASNKVERRSQARAAYSKLAFTNDANELPLVISNGNVAEFDPTEGITSSIIPPRKKSDDSRREEGSVSNMEEIYGELGNSFKVAAWFGKGRKQIVGVLKSAEDETLLVQDLTPTQNGRLPAPIIQATGDKIDMTVSPKTGAVAFTVQRFRFPRGTTIPPQFIKNGKVVFPFRHLVGLLDPAEPSRQLTVMQGKDDETAFGSPVFAPDGNSILLQAGIYQGEGDFVPKVLISVPAQDQAATRVSLVHKGPAYDAAYNADGSSIAYVERSAGDQRALHVMNADGSNDRVIAQGEFRGLRFSPQ